MSQLYATMPPKAPKAPKAPVRRAAQGRHRASKIRESVGRLHWLVIASTLACLMMAIVKQSPAGPVYRTLTLLLAATTGLSVLRLAGLATAVIVHARRRRRRGQGQPGTAAVTVIVPAYNEQDGILATLASVVAATSDQCEIIVVDDGSTDDTAQRVAEAAFPRVRLIRQPNTGKSGALNTGIAAACHELIVMIDGDTVVHPDAIRALVAAADRSPDIAAISGNVKIANRTNLLTWWQHLEYVSGFSLDRRLYEMLGTMLTVPGALGLFRRSALLAVGNFSTATVAEDTDLTLALLQADYRIIYEPAAVAYTEAPASVRQLARQRFRWTYGTFQALWKHQALIAAPGRVGTRGRRLYAYCLLFQVLFPVVSMLADVVMGYLWVTDPLHAAVWFLLAVVTQCVPTGLALRLDNEGYLPLFALPLQQFFYRQFLYLTVLHSLAVAAFGLPVRWQRMHRIGACRDTIERIVPSN